MRDSYVLPITIYDVRSLRYRFHSNAEFTQSEWAKLNGRISEIETFEGYPHDRYSNYGREILHILIRACRRAGIKPRPNSNYYPTYVFPRNDRRIAL